MSLRVCSLPLDALFNRQWLNHIENVDAFVKENYIVVGGDRRSSIKNLFFTRGFVACYQASKCFPITPKGEGVGSNSFGNL
jgi:hypothetical protein